MLSESKYRRIDWYEKPVKRYLMACLCVAPVFC